jgi:hypothetical protein
LLLVASVAAFAQIHPPTLRIESVDVVKTHRELNSIRIVLRNITSEPQSGVLWYVLALPGETEPWRVNSYASPERMLQIAPGKTGIVELAGPEPTLDGVFELTAWLHGVVPATLERFHSDFKAYGAPLVVGPPISFKFDILSDGAEGASHLVRFSVRNNETENANIGLLYRIARVNEKVFPSGPFSRTARIAAGVDYVVTVKHLDPLPPGEWKATAWLFELTGKTSLLEVREHLFEVKD